MTEEWIFEEVDKDKEGQRMVALGLISSDALKKTGVRRVVSSQGRKIDPSKERIVLSGAKVFCGVGVSLEQPFALPDPEVRIGLRGYLDASSAYLCECPGCKSQKEIRGHTTDTPDGGQEYWVLITRTTIDPQYANSPYLGWPLLTAEKVSVEPL
jgi:hypothetical protein